MSANGRSFRGRRRLFVLSSLILAFQLLVVGRARAAIALVQHVSKDAGTTTSSTLAFPASNTAGNWIAVVVRAGQPGQTITVSDTRNNVYRRAIQASQALDPITLAIYYAESIAGGANTVTVSNSLSGGTLRFSIFEYSGVATAASLDGTPASVEGTSTAITSPSIGTTASGDLILGVVATANEATFTAGSGFTLQERVPAAPNTKLAVEDWTQPAPGSVAATASIVSGQTWAAIVAAFKPATAGPPPPADLTLSKTHVGSFTQGQAGATYTLTASNSGTAATVGTVTVTDTLPAGLTATGFSGTGWSCTLSPLACTRTDALAGGASYPAVTLTVNVAAAAPATITNTAIVSGGGETNTANDSVADVTTVVPAGSGSITLVQHTSKDAGTTTSSTLAFASANTAGNWIAVAVRAGQTGQNVTVSDSRGNVYRRALQVSGALDPVTLAIYYAEGIAGGANTVTVSDTIAGGTLRFAIFEYSGVATSGSIDGTPGMAEGTGTALLSPTATTSANGDLILGVLFSAESITVTAGSGFTLQERVLAAPNTKLAVEDLKQAGAGAIAATATLSSSQKWAAAVAAFRPASGGPPPGADLTLSKTHAGSFIQGQVGAAYTLTATNSGSGATSGTVTVTDTLPAGLTATAFSGTGWSCSLSPLTCSRSTVLAAGASYPVLTLTVNVSASAPASVINTAAVSGGGETNTANDSASDPTTIAPAAASQVGQWSAVQNWPIVAVHAHLLPTGNVLAWTDYSINEGVQIWRPATNSFTPKPYSPVSLFCAGHAFLPDGRLLVAGGIVGLSDDTGPRESTIFDPVTESWSAGPLMAQGRYYPTTTTLGDGRVLAQGGTTTCTTCIADMPEIYDPATNAWTTMAASARKAFKYYPHTYQLPDGRVLAAGQNDAAVITQALDLTTQTWTPIDTNIVDGHSSVMYLPGKIMKSGKATADDQGHPSVATTYVLDMTQPSPAWQATASMQFPRSYHNLTVLPDGQVLATGGSTATDKANVSAAVYNAELWSPTSQAWTTMSQAAIPREYHSTALLLPDATVLVAGGGRENGRSQPDPKDQANAEIYSPPYLFRGARPAISTAPSVLQYGTAFTVVTPDAARITKVSLIALSAVTHAFNENQRFVPLTFGVGAGSLDVQPPADGNTAPPGPYMLFLVDNAGIPSVAAMVRVAPSTVPRPDVTLSKTHVGSFTQGQVGAAYTLTATNSGTAATVGTVTVTDTLPAGLTATAFGGTGWSCTLSPLSCNRSTSLAAGASYPAITLTVNVSASAAASVTNNAAVSGGGETNTANDTVADATTVAPAGGAPLTLVQHVGKDANPATSTTLAFASANTAGNFIAVVIRAGKTGQVFTVTDTRGNVYRRALQVSETLDTVTLGVYYAENIAAGANTVTVSDTISGGTLRLALFEYSGVAASNALDGSPVMAEGSSASLVSPTITTTVGGDLILGVLSTAEVSTVTAGGGFTLEERVPAAPGTKLAVEDLKQSSPGPIAATATIGAGQAWSASVVAFKPASAAPPPPNAPKLIITSPNEAGTVNGSTVAVTYTETGDLTEANHTHWQLDANPVVMDLSLDGVFSFTGVHVGAHTLQGFLVRADHSTIVGSDATPVHFIVAVDPADPTVPSVTLTAPAAGATVSGVSTVTANASDNLGVYGVQFKLDGTILGAEDLVAPYSTDWNTASATAGSHTLTAIARDVAGNETTSAPVTVTVSNAGPNDPSVIGQWAGPYNWPLVSVHSMLMPNGKVLLYDDHTNQAGVQVWDPVTDNLTSRPYNANNLFCSGHAMLPDGRVLVVGGHLGTYLGIPDATIFDPTSENWSAAATMSQARWYPTATSLPDGRVLAMSGAIDCPTCNDPNGSHNGIALIPEVYDPRSNAWTRLTSASLSLPLYPHMHVLPDGRVLAVGSAEDPIVSRALDINAQTWTVVDPVARDGGSSVQYRPGKILKTGTGRNPDYVAVPSAATAWVLDTTLPSPAWRAIAPMSFARTQHNLTVLPDGNVLAVGGSTNTNVYDTAGTVKTAELWNPTTETWRTLATMQEPRHYHSTSLLLPDGRVVVSGGGRFGPDFPSAEIYSPPYLFKGARPTITSVPGTIQYNSHVTVGTPDGARIAKVTLVRLGSPTHAFDENQRYVELAYSPVAGGLDVTVPSGQNIIIPGHYMLSLVDTNGIPSVSTIVRFPAPWEDTVPPTAPSGLGATTSPGRVDLSWTPATDNTGVALYNVHRGTLPGVVPTVANRLGQTATTTFRDTGFATGTYYYVVTAQDAGGTVGPPSNEFVVAAQADVTPPVTSITAPTSGATLSGLTTIAANATDDIGVKGVQFLLDGGSLGAEVTAAPYSFAWNTGLALNGAHTVSARARDARGNTTDATGVGVTVQNTAIQGLMAAYSCDDATGTLVRDSSINGNNATTRGATWTTSGHTLGGLAFTPNTYADAPNSAALDVAGKGLTVEMWANITAGNSVDYVLLNKPWAATGQPYPYYQYGIEYDANGARTLDFFFGDTAGQSIGPYSMLPQTGVWTHIAFTYDGTSVKGYLDGILKVTGAATTDIQARGNPLRIGVDGSFQQGFNGKLDDIRIYNRALTQTEIQQDMTHPVILP